MLFLLLLFNLICSKSIIAYFAIFDDGYSSTMSVSQKIPWKIFDTIVIAFANLDRYGNLTNSHATNDDKIRKVISLYRKSRPDGKVEISLYDERDNRFLYAANNSEHFSKSVQRYLKRYNMNGFDLDWETVLMNTYNKSLVALLRSCYGKFKVSHTIWPGVHDPATVGLLTNIVDEINIMSYRIDISQIESLINQYNRSGFPYEKIVLGMDTESQYETKDTISDKLKLIDKYKLAGLFVWRLDNDGIPRDDNGTAIGPPEFNTTKILLKFL